MERKLVVVINELTADQKERIKEEALKYGFTPMFFVVRGEDPLADKKLADTVADAEVIFSSLSALAASAGKLKWFCTPFAGVEEYSLPGAFASPDAVLTNSSGAYGVTISEHVVMSVLRMLRREPEYSSFVAQKKWVRSLPVRSIHGSRILLAGTGDIGREIAKRFKSFDPASIIGINRHGKNPGGPFDAVFSVEHLDEHLGEADLIVMSMPGTAETRHLMNAERLSRIHDGAVLINVGRGRCIDEKALAAELRSGRLYAALDVFEKEPLPDDSELWNCPNLCITPHVSGNLTLPYTRNRVVEMFLENLKLYAEGRPMLRQIDLKKGY